MNLHHFTVSLDENDAINSASLAHQYRDKIKATECST